MKTFIIALPAFLITVAQAHAAAPARAIVAVNRTDATAIVEVVSDQSILQYEVCPVDLGANAEPNELNRQVNAEGIVCASLSNVTLDAKDEGARTTLTDAFVRNYSASALPSNARKLWAAQTLTVATGAGLVGIPLFANTRSAAQWRAMIGFTRRHLRSGPRHWVTGVGLVAIAAPMLIARALYLGVREADDVQVQIDFMGLGGRLTPARFPIVSSGQFNLIANALTRALEAPVSAASTVE